jgi:5'-nucleotidase (lipoprotein e(P4) family)
MDLTTALRALLLLSMAGCAPPPGDSPDVDLGIAWVRDAAEYRASSLQAYGMAAAALDGKISDTSWSALPGQSDAAALPPAVILDVDETSITNAEFQAALVPPFRESKLNRWSDDHAAVAVPGAVDFVNRAIEAGVAVFFVTNRACERARGMPCPQEAVVVTELQEAGFPASEENVLLAGERPEWTREKLIRRQHIGADYRVIMLFGDDLGDFIACSRRRPLDPCEVAATRQSRWSDVNEHAHRWGNGWYVLPNPMHGSWTSVE